jgi:hypothetical protein
MDLDISVSRVKHVSAVAGVMQHVHEPAAALIGAGSLGWTQE